MARAYQIATICEVYNAACDQFESMLGELQSERAIHLEHEQVETTIGRMGNELMRLLMQAHLDLRSFLEQRRFDVKNTEGKLLTDCRSNCKRDLMTMFGEVEARRKGYSSKEENSLFPLDAELNLASDKYSHGLRRRVAEEAATNSFDETLAGIKKTTGGKVPKRQAEEITARASQDFEKFYSTRQAQGQEPTADILVMSVDQKGIVMRKEDLRPGTRKAAEKASHRPAGSRLSPGEKKDRKRMATVAAVYGTEARERSPEQIMGLCPKEDKSARPKCRNKRVWASVEQEPEEVIRAMLDEALRRDPEKKRIWTVLLDGAEKQLDIVLDLIFRIRRDVILVLDFIHVLEYVWRAAYSFHAVGSKEAEQWVAERALKILQGDAAGVAAGLRRSACGGRLEPGKRDAVEKCADYLEKLRHPARLRSIP